MKSAAKVEGLNYNKSKVAVLCGGVGEERQVSLESGQAVFDALNSAGVNVFKYDITPENLEIFDDKSIDVFFLALHGRFGEDGNLQQILEDKSLAYTGSGPKACFNAFDKMISKKLFAEAGLLVPKAIDFNSSIKADALLDRLKENTKYVVKPVRQGSSVGVSIVQGVTETIETAKDCLAEFGSCMIEEFIQGREVTVGILCDQVLPIVEVKTKQGFYDFHAKYIDDKTQYLFDTIDDQELIKKLNDAAMSCFNILGCRHFARIDFIVSKDNRPFVLEANAIPGLTSHSLLPKAAKKVDISMAQLCLKLIETALIGSGNKMNLNGKNKSLVL
jgi:D-alanine-D-alanine ligase